MINDVGKNEIFIPFSPLPHSSFLYFFPSRIATVHWSIVLKFLIDDFIVCEVIVPAKHPLLIPTSCLAFGETSLANFQCGDWAWQNCS